MLEILKTLNVDQRDALADISVVLACMVFLLGYGLKVLTDRMEQRVETWQQAVAMMPSSVKRDIAIDYCVANNRLCRNLPMEGNVK